MATAQRALRALALESAALHADLHADGFDTGFARRGLLNVYGSEAAFRIACADADADRADGLPAQAFDASQIRAEFPYVSDAAVGAIFGLPMRRCDPHPRWAGQLGGMHAVRPRPERAGVAPDETRVSTGGT